MSFCSCTRASFQSSRFSTGKCDFCDRDRTNYYKKPTLGGWSYKVINGCAYHVAYRIETAKVITKL